MRIAVPYEEGNIYFNLGHTKQIKVYEIEEGKVIGTAIADVSGTGHDVITEYLKELEIDIVICDKLCMGSQLVLKDMGIDYKSDVQGDADQAVSEHLKNFEKFM